MHEIGLVDDIISVIRARLKASGEDSKVKKVNILIGELEHVTPDHFEFHFRERAKGTSLENAELSFKKVVAKFKCKGCKKEFSGREGLNGCPGCGSKTNDIIAGSGISVESVEIYD
ncbi:MAG: hydrogenase maturation nickel metallochaperone HypA [Candidatus Omnitrophica bacterium]|nr:hydrogenase maturation nickel metallochaperone HypA [Candidatus Omnitrophota bacterium]